MGGVVGVCFKGCEGEGQSKKMTSVYDELVVTDHDDMRYVM